MVREETYKKWVNKFGDIAIQALNMQYASSKFGKELGRIFLDDIINHIKKNTIVYISDEDWILYTPKPKQNIMKLNTIMSMNKKGSVLLQKLEEITISQNIPIIELLVIKGIPAEQWYYKKGFVKVGEQVAKSKNKTIMYKLQKKLFKFGLEKYDI